jgi:hypothetical protein
MIHCFVHSTINRLCDEGYNIKLIIVLIFSYQFGILGFFGTRCGLLMMDRANFVVPDYTFTTCMVYGSGCNEWKT